MNSTAAQGSGASATSAGIATLRERIPAAGELRATGTHNGVMKFPSRYCVRTVEGRFVGAFVVGSALIAAASGCSSDLFAEPPCFPPEYSVTPTTAGPGDVVTVEAPGADCNPRYGENAQIQVIVTDEQGEEVINTTAPMTDAGAFTYTFPVPDQMVIGEAAVTAMPHDVDWCDDTGRNNRAQGTVNLERASCAEPVKPLTITR